MFKLRCLNLIGLFVPILLFAQKEEKIYRHFKTQEAIEMVKKSNPEYSKKLEEIDKAIEGFVANDDQSLQIPIVFHIISSPDSPVLDEEQVKSQLETLNKYFLKYNNELTEYPTKEVEKFYQQGVDIGLSFCVPTKINDVAGINFIKTDTKIWGTHNDVKDPEKGGFAPIDPDHIINVWVCSLDGLNAGYALLPSADKSIDGIVIDFKFFGNEKGTAKAPFTEGKTLVHLIGNYLGLYDLWNDYYYCTDDKVADTPIHSGPNDIIVIEKENRHISMCQNELLDMYMNFMDNTNDSLLTLFTKGQKNRIWAMLSEKGPRATMGRGELPCSNFNTFVSSRQMAIGSNKLALYPNPTSNEVMLDITSTEKGNANITFLNSLGSSVLQQNYVMEKGIQRLTIDCSSLSDGLYFVKVQFADKSQITKTLSIEH